MWYHLHVLIECVMKFKMFLMPILILVCMYLCNDSFLAGFLFLERIKNSWMHACLTFIDAHSLFTQIARELTEQNKIGSVALTPFRMASYYPFSSGTITIRLLLTFYETGN